MAIATFLLLVCILIVVIGSLIYVRRRIYSAKQSFIDTYIAFVSPKDNQTGSNLDNTIDYLASAFAKRLVSTLTSVDNQRASVDKRIANELERDMTTDLITSEHPELGLILQYFPSVKRRLLKNPGAVQQFLPLAGKFIAGLKASPGAGNGRGSAGDLSQRIRENL